MGLAVHQLAIEEFVGWEAEQVERHEYYRGEVFAMVGGTRGHNRVVLNIASRMNLHLDGSPCQVFSETMKLRVADEAILYPDVMVSCDRQFTGRELAITEPVLIIEVLSPSTQRYDRSDKFAIYRKLPSLREYVLIDPETRRVEAYRPWTDGRWSYLDMSELPALTLESVGMDLPLTQIFSGMQSEEPGAA